MLQYRIKNSDEAAKALAEGARWLTLACPTEESIREIIPLCHEAGVILVTEGHPQMALETLAGEVRVSGVILGPDDLDPSEARELLGPHAIIGYAATTPEEILRLTPLDVDYFTLPAEAMSPTLAAVETPIVAIGASELPEGFMGLLKDF